MYLLTIHNVVLAVGCLDGAALELSDVAAAARLGHAEANDLLA